MGRAVAALLVAFLLAGARALPDASPRSPLFSLKVPLEMVTGRVLVKANTADQNVTVVRWQVEDWARLTPPPFELVFDAGPIPYERRVTAIALDKDRRPLYRQEAILNPGGRLLLIEPLSPVEGETVSGPVAVHVRVRTPADDEPEAVFLDDSGRELPLTRLGPRSDEFQGFVTIPRETTVLVVRMRTRRGREAEKTILVNGKGFLAESDAHVVEQLVAVSRNRRPVLDLSRGDFTVSDEKGACEIRESLLLRNAPLSLGFAIDTSISLRHTEELRQVVANQFIEQCLGERDSAFLMAFGPVVVKVLDWSRSRRELQKAVLALPDSQVPGTPLYEAIQKALYQLQGQQGARALLLVTDGHDHEGDVSEAAALQYARQSGVKIFALGLTSSFEVVTPLTKQSEDGTIVTVEMRRDTVVQPTNVAVLDRFTEATGGRTYLVKRAEDLPKIFREIEEDIRTQYLLSYVSTARRRSTFHPVEVRARRGTVKTAPGFFY